MSFRNVEGLRLAFKNASALLKPPPKMTPVEWAEKSLRIPAGNALPGPIRFDNAPHQREPLNLMFSPLVERISLMWGAQVGKTQVLACGQAFAVVMSPRSQMMMQPSQGDLGTWLETKWNPLVASTPALRQRIAKPRSRTGVNNSRMKSYPGGFMLFAWAGSPKTMRGRSAPFIGCDEVDGYTVTEEGHPVSLLWQRAATFGDQRKLVEISTPTIKGGSYIEAAFLAGDQRRFHIRCPHCQHEQTLKWDNVMWVGKKETDGENLKHIEDHDPNTAAYACAGCGTLINDGERLAAVRAGRWIAAKPFKGHASFHISELYSTFRRMRDIVKSYLEKLAQDDLQTFWNVSLAETWSEVGEQALPEVIQARAEPYAGTVPDGVLYVTCGVDMQMDRFEMEVVGWGLNEESWSLDYRIIHGEAIGPEPWLDLEAALAERYVKADGTSLKIAATCFDTGGTGGYTQAAYDWLKKQPASRRIFGIKGMSGWDRPIVAAPNRKQSGKEARKVDLYIVGTDQAKLTLMRRLQNDKPGTPGYCHHPDTYEDEYYKQLCAEKLVSRRVKGFTVREWHAERDRNEALDVRVYAHAALKILNPKLTKLAAKAAAKAEEVAMQRVAEGVVEKVVPDLAEAAAAQPPAPVAVPAVPIPENSPAPAPAVAKARPKWGKARNSSNWNRW